MDEPTPYPYRPSPPPARREESAVFRVGDLERSAACDALAEHYAAGRLDPAELEDRLARAMAARSQGDLRVLFTDLRPRRTVPAAVRSEVPVESSGRDAARPVVAAVMVLALLLAGGMLMLLGAVDAALALAALVGGTATAVAGACATLLVQAASRRR